MSEIHDGANCVHATATAGGIRFTRGGQAVRKFDGSVDRWLEGRYLEGVDTLHVVALPVNSALIAAAARIVEARGVAIHLRSPLLLPFRKQREDAGVVLAASRQSMEPQERIAPSAGGWHRMMPSEGAVYRAAAMLAAGDDAKAMIRELEGHPLWLRLKFINPRNEETLARVVAALRDPRWYVDLQKPTSQAKLYAYMGLSFDLAEDDDSVLRRDDAVSAWRIADKAPSGTSQHPRGFLWRHFYKSEAAAMRRERSTTKLFLRFLRSVWTDLLAAEAGRRGEPLFVSQYFFDEALEMKLQGELRKDPMANEIAWAYDHFLIETGATR